ncbi:DUF397 domain-containing protein [Streptomyces sp. HU2014]|nr:DUF397 domain-containing protein [Streptomyces sp. HU2014]UQI49476.1 DUF397 domain-containing protein [Streptomyces sp. HU2014]
MEIPGTGIAGWRKSSYSGLENDCVEVADGYPGIVPVRDSKAPSGPTIVLGSGTWSEFVDGVKAGGFPVTG